MKAQLSNPTLDQLLQALIYYYENDAFINSYWKTSCVVG